MIAGVAAGICIGALPGLTATMGVALLLPLTFGMDATAGILMLLGIYVGAIYGGSISAILLHTPGTPASAATAIDGYQFSKRGEAGRALGIATLSSYVGGVVSVLCLWLISPQLAKLALKFSSAEFFLLAVFGLCIIANISGENMAKGLILRNLNSYCRYRQRNKLHPFHRQRKPSLRYPVHPGYDRSLRDEPGFRDHRGYLQHR